MLRWIADNATIVPNPREATNLMALPYVALVCESLLSRGILAELESYPPAAVVYAGKASTPAPSPIPVTAPSGVAGLVAERGWPMIRVPSRGIDACYADVSAFSPEMLLLACFPLVLDARWLALPAKGVLNIHPSLLPRYRGPSPLYWQRLHRERSTGVTVHWATEGLDAGPIVAQSTVSWTREEDDSVVVARQAAVAGALLRAVFPALAALETPQWAGLRGRRQDEGLATRFGWPP